MRWGEWVAFGRTWLSWRVPSSALKCGVNEKGGVLTLRQVFKDSRRGFHTEGDVTKRMLVRDWDIG